MLALLQGGAYLTLLNTVANMGVILPKLAIFAAIDWLSARTCVGSSSPVSAAACPANHAKVCCSELLSWAKPQSISYDAP